ncbi:MBOAT family O-acyltransferase [Lacisediminihabitans profunda]|uniref:MBOAT family protein n=1 Tax=Lacisediminihabitans profunda TaxID=2594790 RepID=A0A5C8UK97_9MICO|nr:MBOAT family protein [Lacisediminihabitans profunda]TXN28227.1 MBOAT family protein [Lacisediminihabitans profunda]
MSFASPVFLWYFLPAVLALYVILPKTWRNGLLSVASLLFYVWGAGEFVFLLLACMAVNFAAGILIDSAWAKDRQKKRRAILIAAIVFDVLILAIWKYGGFLSVQVHNLSQSLGLANTTIIALALPIGISFFTFHHMSYVIDVYRGSRTAQKSPIQFITYIAMFPQLIAGPIVRYNEISDQLADTNRDRWADISRGLPRFALGLSKKVIVADSVSPIADAAFATANGDLTSSVAWLGAIAYTVQIYFDFSAYSDMAIGLGQMFGFRLPENFNRPYSANSITDFWRRWHMSLSRWFRDYVYISLGGNRNGKFNTYRNLIIIFFLTGFWHGAAWTFVVWGMYHGALMVIERLTGVGTRESTSTAETVIRRVITFFLVVVGWVFFRAHGMQQVGAFLHAMFWPTTGPIPDTITAAWSTQGAILLAFGFLVVLLPPTLVMGRVIENFSGKPGKIFRVAVICLFAPYAALAVAAGTFSPFLYFQF